MEDKTVSRILDEIAEEICDKYCKWPYEYEDTEELLNERCETCPLSRL